MLDYKKLHERYVELKGDKKRLPDGAAKILMEEFDLSCKSIYTMELNRANKMYREY